MNHIELASLGIFVLFLLFLPLLRQIILGPTAIDRMICVNAIGTKTTVAILLIGIATDNLEMVIDLSLTYALLNYLGSIGAARYLRKHKAIIKQERGQL